jgi:hypothetical protein
VKGRLAKRLIDTPGTMRGLTARAWLSLQDGASPNPNGQPLALPQTFGGNTCQEITMYSRTCAEKNDRDQTETRQRAHEDQTRPRRLWEGQTGTGRVGAGANLEIFS